jgi:uncharacterized protein YgiM (DUF1202 family)
MSRRSGILIMFLVANMVLVNCELVVDRGISNMPTPTTEQATTAFTGTMPLPDTPTPSETPERAIVTVARSLWVRESGVYGSRVSGILLTGEIVEIRGDCQNGWIRIRGGSVSGWVNGKYINGGYCHD